MPRAVLKHVRQRRVAVNAKKMCVGLGQSSSPVKVDDWEGREGERNPAVKGWKSKRTGLNMGDVELRMSREIYSIMAQGPTQGHFLWMLNLLNLSARVQV